MAQLKIIFLGDIMGKIGRKGVKELLPKIKKQYKPDLVIANAENLAHGKGITEKTLKEMISAGVDFFTSGNHVWDNPEAEQIFSENKLPIIRPANYPEGTSGDGYKIIEIGTKKILVANVMGRVFMKENFNCPFRVMEAILEETKNEKLSAIICDIHAEATSEKSTFGNYFDGQASLIVGTHTHIATADEQILKKGTGYITDVGMCGAKYSSLGVDFKNVTKNFLTQMSQTFEIPEHGTCQINGIFVIIKPENRQAQMIERFTLETNI